MSMDPLTFSEDVATMIATLSVMHAMTTNTMTKQAFALDPKHCNTHEAPLVTIRM
ncbi:MAG TPA: hypothetical protein VFJ51_03045 [Nitrososphaeraceae archaeon]|nr:hypothetical protein [Nitrososphaeraceae archaeon]